MSRMGKTQKKNLENLRKMRAYAMIAKGDMPKVVDKEKYIVRSQSDSEKRYTVENNGSWTCTCPDHQETGLMCKHIQSVQMFLQLRDNADVLNLENEIDGDEIRCDRCESLNVIKRGKRKTKNGEKQRYECKECGRRFTDNREKYRKANKELIALTMDLYFKGLSTRKIADTLEQFYGVEVHHTTVSRWINAYMEKINEKTKELEPNVGEVWHVDEQKIKVDGEWHYSWNVMDENRYLIANTITKERSILETEMVLRKALKNAKGVKPRVVITDGMSSYPAAIRNVFGDKTIHIGNVGIRDRINNNVLERYHGTYRERDKVMRGLYNGGTARQMNDNIRTYYNFIRPHSGIEGFTPAQQAGITTDVSHNRWMGLLNQSL